jgi:hypothetical protein
MYVHSFTSCRYKYITQEFNHIKYLYKPLTTILHKKCQFCPIEYFTKFEIFPKRKFCNKCTFTIPQLNPSFDFSNLVLFSRAV